MKYVKGLKKIGLDCLERFCITDLYNENPDISDIDYALIKSHIRQQLLDNNHSIHGDNWQLLDDDNNDVYLAWVKPYILSHEDFKSYTENKEILKTYSFIAEAETVHDIQNNSFETQSVNSIHNPNNKDFERFYEIIKKEINDEDNEKIYCYLSEKTYGIIYNINFVIVKEST
ncbi:MAG: hypothetical protein CL760_11125 [Chloroflexi bacterium]|nr:hypothetical protein [Chloroflexota bacterium]|tara:strand:- start:348 stop:866 length:519 start_codon:yes stop_codon:yes gene_type:complete